MQHIFFFVGLDRTGKTTISKEFSNLTDIPYFKNPSEKKIFKNDNLLALNYVAPTIYEICKQTDYSFIFDRGFPCEYAYSKAYNRETDYDLIFEIDRKFSFLNTTIILCDKPNLFDNFQDDLVQKDKIKDIQKYYKEFINKTKCKVLYLDTSDENLDSQLKFLQQTWINNNYKGECFKYG
jgi:hypothetical protein